MLLLKGGTMAEISREFASTEVSEALRYIEALPERYWRVYVEARDGIRGWVFTYGDWRQHVPRLLSCVIRGRRVRVRGAERICLQQAPDADRVGPPVVPARGR